MCEVRRGRDQGGEFTLWTMQIRNFAILDRGWGGREQSLRTVDPLVASCQHVVHGDCMLGLFGYNNGSVSNCEEG